jgi:hypothetical protein
MKFFSQGDNIIDIHLRLDIKCSYDVGGVGYQVWAKQDLLK